MAGPQERLRFLSAVNRTRKIVGIIAGIAAQMAWRVIMHHDKAHRPVRLRLQNEFAVELQRRTHHRRQRDRLAGKQQDLLSFPRKREPMIR
jgi:hypothetical protein